MTKTVMLAALAMLALGGCGSPRPQVATEDRAAAESAARARGEVVEVEPPAYADQTRYTCENGSEVRASYSEAGAELAIDGQRYALASQATASGARYRSETGRAPGKTLGWWVNADSAMLIDGIPGDTEGDQDVILVCQKV